jgi:schlafen family protein
VASSQAQRLKPHAIDVRVNVDPVQWFLNDRHDTRSSYYLEDAATEFQVQGLELDWVCVTWDADLRRHAESWRYHSFRGDAWTTIHKQDRRQYLLNAYRLLLTRARQGMVIFVPPGDESDPTRLPAFYNDTYGYLTGLGVAEF